MPDPVEGDNTISVTLGTPATADTLTPPVNDGFSRIDPTVDNVSDVDGVPVKVEETKPVVPAEDKAAADAKAAGEKVAAEKADLERFDKHPRFQELLKERDAFKHELADIKGQLKVLTPSQKAEVEKREEKALPYKDITKMSKETILEWQEDDPVGYAANLYQQMLHETRETINKEQVQVKTVEQRQTAVRERYDSYAKANPNFMELWNAGEIQRVMDFDPILFPNAIAAHMAITLHNSGKTVQGQIDAAVAKAVTEAEARVTKNFQAKRNAEVISDGGSVKSEDTADELKNPDKYGGTTTVLADRLSRGRQAAAGG